MLSLNLTQENYTHFKGDAIIAFTHKKHTDTLLNDYLELAGFQHKTGSTLTITLPNNLDCKQLIIASFGEDTPNETQYQATLKSALSIVNKLPIKSLWLELSESLGIQTLQTCAANIANSLYQYQPKAENISIQQVSIYTTLTNTDTLNKGLAIAQGMALSRQLSDLPSNICTPSYLADTALDLAKQYNLGYEILETDEMQTLGMGSLLSVAKGSDEPPKLITLHHQGGAKSDQPIVLIGKGVTFDSGGISLKPGTAMDEMKYDMCGAASVLGVMKTIAQLKLPINVTMIVPSVENMPSARASKPGDVVTSMSGQTIEILNTDAEGRLILCDAMTYAQQFNPKAIIDVATLTGAIIIALGREFTGLMSNAQPLVEALKTAGTQAGDEVWQLPINDEYDKLLKSNFADMANIGNREAGSITAACFLSRFTDSTDWAHLDIAGTAWNTGANKGATGRPVALLAQYILNQCH